MGLEEILKDINLATLRKKAEIHKSDLSDILFDSVSKATNSGISMLEVLVYEAVIKKDRNEFMFNQYLNGYVLNHSVGMRYIKIYFCYNSDDPQYTQEKDNYDKYLPQIVNITGDAPDHFWAVTEARNIEGSAVVKGSNYLTPVLERQIIDDTTIRVKLAISPSNILDSHSDVHIQGLWKKSISENTYNLLLQEHEMDFDKVITDSISGDLKVYTQMVSVKELLSRFQKNKSEPSQDTQKPEPLKNTQKFNVLEAIKNEKRIIKI